MAQLQCQSCGAPVTVGEPIPRDSECDSCRADLRSCRNCRHFDPRYHNSCRETMADPVEDKQRRNFCEYFSFSRDAYRAPATQSNRGTEARARLDALFGGAGSSSTGSSEAKKRIDSLFGGAAAKPDRETEARRKLDALFGKKPTEPDSKDPPSGR